MTQAQDMVAELLICGQFQSFLKVRFLGDKICFEGTGLKRGLGVSWLFFFFPFFFFLRLFETTYKTTKEIYRPNLG